MKVLEVIKFSKVARYKINTKIVFLYIGKRTKRINFTKELEDNTENYKKLLKKYRLIKWKNNTVHELKA